MTHEKDTTLKCQYPQKKTCWNQLICLYIVTAGGTTDTLRQLQFYWVSSSILLGDTFYYYFLNYHCILRSNQKEVSGFQVEGMVECGWFYYQIRWQSTVFIVEWHCSYATKYNEHRHCWISALITTHNTAMVIKI